MSLQGRRFSVDIPMPSDKCYKCNSLLDGACDLVDKFAIENVELCKVLSLSDNRFLNAILFLYDCTENVLLEGVEDLTSLKDMMYALCVEGEQVMHVPQTKVKDVLFEQMKVVSLCHFEYINTLIDCERAPRSVKERFFEMFFKEDKICMYVPVVFTGWEDSELQCHVFFDSSVSVIKVPICDLHYFSSLWTCQME